jgi:hypothetical protein
MLVAHHLSSEIHPLNGGKAPRATYFIKYDNICEKKLLHIHIIPLIAEATHLAAFLFPLHLIWMAL